MKIKPFAVEEWMNAWEVGAKYNIAETCVDSISMDELFALTGEDKDAFLTQLCARRLSYGDIEGLPAFRHGTYCADARRIRCQSPCVLFADFAGRPRRKHYAYVPAAVFHTRIVWCAGTCTAFTQRE